MFQLFDNGNFVTFDATVPRAAALLLSGDQIMAVGKASDFSGLPIRTRYDLGGRTVLPGLIDAHTHFTEFALQNIRVNLRDLTSYPAVLKTIREYVATMEPGEWILGGRWDRNIWQGGEKPHRRDLDAISTQHPIALSSKDGHSMWVNSTVLEIIGYSAETPNPPGGDIGRDPETGELTGILKENALHPIFDNIVPPNETRMRQAVLQGIERAHALGLTGVHCMETPDTFRRYDRLCQEGLLKLRVCHTIPDHFLDDAIRLGIQTYYGNEWLRVGQVKIFSDGALGSLSAHMLEPYEGTTDNYGIGTYTAEELVDLVMRANQHNLAVAVHAIGDRANRHVIDAIESARATTGHTHLRNRIEHVQLLHEADQPRLAQLGIIASMQPIHTVADVEIAERHWGQRSRNAYVFRNLLNHGTHLAFSSDAPIETIDPFQGIYAAVERKYLNNPKAASWYPDQKLSITDAVHAYTMGAAYASGEEQLKGSLSAGKLADFIVLDRDMFTDDTTEILKTRVDAVVMGGECVYGDIERTSA